MKRVLLTCLCALALAAPAQAQDPQVDPDSPAGTEYQLPIDRAREQAREGSRARGGAQDGSGSAEAPLFGTGVEARKPDKQKPRAKAGSDRDPARTADLDPDVGTSTPETVRAQAPAADEGGSGLLAIGAGGAGVLLIGGLAGLAWRRRANAS